MRECIISSWSRNQLDVCIIFWLDINVVRSGRTLQESNADRTLFVLSFCRASFVSREQWAVNLAGMSTILRCPSLTTSELLVAHLHPTPIPIMFYKYYKTPVNALMTPRGSMLLKVFSRTSYFDVISKTAEIIYSWCSNLVIYYKYLDSKRSFRIFHLLPLFAHLHVTCLGHFWNGLQAYIIKYGV